MIDWNLQAEVDFGYSRTEAIGRDLGELIIPPDQREVHNRGMRYLETTGEGPILNCRIEVTAKHRSGREFPVELTVIPIVIEGARVFYSFIRDLSPSRRQQDLLRQAEEASREHESQLTLITDALPAFVAYVGKDLRYHFANASYEKAFGLPRDSIVGKPTREVLGDEAFKRGESYMRRALEGERARYETRLPGFGGEMLWIDTEYLPDFDPSGKVRGFVVLGHDITDRKKAEEATQESEALFRTLFEQTPFSTQLLTFNGRTLRVNSAWKKLWDVSDEFVESFILKEYNLLSDPQLRAKGVVPFILRALAGESVQVPPMLYDPAELGKPGRPRWVKAFIYPVRSDAGVRFQHIVLIHEDVTEQISAAADQKVLSDLYIHLTEATETGTLVEVATRQHAKRLRASRYWLCEIDDEAMKAVVHQDYAEGLPSLQGEYDLRAFGDEMVKIWRTGSVVRVDDVTSDSRTAAHAEVHLSHGIASFVTIPLHRGGKMVGGLNVSSQKARERMITELDLVRAVAENLWSAIEKARLYLKAQDAVRARDEFISICSHEIKTPVTSMKLQFQMAQRLMDRGDQRAFDPAETAKRIASTNRQLDRMTRLIDDMPTSRASPRGACIWTSSGRA